MKLKDLKSGMIIVNREGRKGIVLLDTLNGNIIGGFGGGRNQYTWKPLQIGIDIREDLTSPFHKDNDIMSVYTPTGNMVFGSDDITRMKLLWERPIETIELTMEQIAEKLGVDVKLLKIVK